MKLLISSSFFIGLFLNVRGFSQVAQQGVYQPQPVGVQQYPSGPQQLPPPPPPPQPSSYSSVPAPPVPPPAPGGYGAAPAPAPGGYGAAPAPAPGGYGAAPAPAPGGYGAPPAPAPGGYGAPPAPAPGGYGPGPLPPTPQQASCSSSSQSLGLPTCQLDPNCYDTQAECAIANGVMFQRTTGGSCSDCLTACSNNQAPTSPYICRAATYDYNWQICDLFSVNGSSSPQALAQYPGRDYFRYKPGCSGGNTAPPSGGNEVCPSGQVTRWAKAKDNAGSGTPNPVASASSADACRQACLSQGASCQAYQFGGGSCATFSSGYTGPTDVTATPGTDYYSRVCVAQGQAGPPCDLQIVPNNVLVGFVQEVHDATSLTDCINQCLAASTFCKSGMYYPQDPNQNCLLNSDTKDSQPTVFVPESPNVPMSYFQVCGSKRKNFNLVLRDQGDIDERWTSWGTTCSTGYQFRYLRCKEKDVRKCPKQTRECEVPTSHPLTPLEANFKKQIEEQSKGGNGECLAVRDQHGEKHCPHGAKTLPNGRRTYCTPPVDCPAEN